LLVEAYLVGILAHRVRLSLTVSAAPALRSFILRCAAGQGSYFHILFLLSIGVNQMVGKLLGSSAEQPDCFHLGKRTLMCLLAVVMLAPAAASGGNVRTVALSGDEAPGAPDGAVFSGFFYPSMNDLGEVLFFAVLEQGPGGVTTANDQGYWSDATGALDSVAFESEAAPGIAGASFGNSFEAIGMITNSKHVFFGHTLPVGPGGVTANDNYTFWKGQDTSLNLLFRENEEIAPALAGTQAEGLFPLINGFGQTAAISFLRTGVGGVTDANDGVIWTDRSGAKTVVARSGDAPPGMPGAVYESVSAPNISDAGYFAFGADLLEGMGGVTAADDNALWSDRGGTFEIVYREGEEAPGVPGSKFDLLSSPQTNGLGRLAFRAEMKVGEGGVTDNDKEGLWAENELGLQLVARQGDPAPDLPGFVMEEILSSWITIQMNNSDAVAYTVDLDGPGSAEDGGSIWSTVSGSPSLVMRRGMLAPGTADGVTFSGYQSLTMTLNERGQTGFAGLLQGPGVSGANDFGIWAQDIHGVLQPIVIEGQMLEVAPGDMREIELLLFGEFNDQGETAFAAYFSDGSSGVFVSSAVAVPEPTSLALLLLGGLLLLSRRFRGGRRGAA
jgi:hypothetical protein